MNSTATATEAIIEQAPCGPVRGQDGILVGDDGVVDWLGGCVDSLPTAPGHPTLMARRFDDFLYGGVVGLVGLLCLLPR